MTYKKQVGAMLLAVILALTIGAAPFSSPASGETSGEKPFVRVIAIVPEWSGFTDLADEWNFGAVLVTALPEALEARFIGARIGDQFISSVKSECKNEWTEVEVVRGEQELEEALDRYEELHELRVRRQAGLTGIWTEDFAERIEREYYDSKGQIYTRLAELREAGEEIEGIVVRIPSVALALGETIIVELIFAVRKAHGPIERITALTSVTKLGCLVVEDYDCLVVEDGSAWFPGDLDPASIYSDGRYNLFHLRDTNPGFKQRGYRFVYMGDQVGYRPGGCPRTWPQHLRRTVCLCPTGTGFPPRCNRPTTWECYVITIHKG